MSDNVKLLKIADLVTRKDWALSAEEAQVLENALWQADVNADEALDRDEFALFREDEAGKNLFNELYLASTATGLRNKLFYDIDALFVADGTPVHGPYPEGHPDRLAKRSEVLRGGYEAVLAQEKEFRDGNAWLPDSEVYAASAYANYVRFRDKIPTDLKRIDDAFESGDFETAQRHLRVADADLKGARGLWQSYLRAVSEGAGDHAEANKDVVAGCVLAEAVILTGGIALEAVPVAVGALGVSGTGHVGAGLLWVDVSGNHDAVPSAVVNPKVEDPSVDAAENVEEISEPAFDADSPRLRTREELIDEAQKKLREFKMTVRLDMDLSEFLFESTFLMDGGTPEEFAERLPEFQAWRAGYLKAAGREWGWTDGGAFENQVDSIRETLYADGTLFAYRGGKAHLTQGTQNDAATQGGNCDYRAQLLIGDMVDGRFPTQAPWIPGVQRFTDHVQPVLYNPETREVWDLVSGNIVSDVVSRIYAPAVMLWSYVSGQGVIPDISYDDLIIARPGENGSVLSDSATQVLSSFQRESRQTDTILSYPPGDIPYQRPGSDPIPDFAIGSFERSHRTELPAADGAVVGGGGAVALWRSAWTWVTEDSPETPPPEPERIRGQVFSGTLDQAQARREFDLVITGDSTGEAPNYGNIREALQNGKIAYAHFADTRPGSRQTFFAFPDAAQAEVFSHLDTPQEKADYLVYLENNRLKAALSQPELQRVQDLLIDPQALMRVPAADLETMRARLDDLSPWFSGTRKGIGTSAVLHLNDARAPGQSEADWKYPKTVEFPSLLPLADNLKAFCDDLKKHPKEFLTALNVMPEEGRFQLLQLLGALSANFDGKGKVMDPLYEVLADPAQVGFSEKGQTPPPQSGYPKIDAPEQNPGDLHGEEDVFSVTIILDDFPEADEFLGRLSSRDSQDQVHDARSRESGGFSEAAPIVISPRTFLDFMELHPYRPILRRWTPEFSAEFEKLNRDGRYDDLFATYFQKIVEARLGVVSAGLDPAAPLEDFIVKTSAINPANGDTVDSFKSRPLPPDVARLLAQVQKRTPLALGPFLATQQLPGA